MNTDMLLRHFETAANAPDTIPALRVLFWIWPCAVNWCRKTPQMNPPKIAKTHSGGKEKTGKDGENKKEQSLAADGER